DIGCDAEGVRNTATYHNEHQPAEALSTLGNDRLLSCYVSISQTEGPDRYDSFPRGDKVPGDCGVDVKLSAGGQCDDVANRRGDNHGVLAVSPPQAAEAARRSTPE